jgi:hypothetical protein
MTRVGLLVLADRTEGDRAQCGPEAAARAGPPVVGDVVGDAVATLVAQCCLCPDTVPALWAVAPPADADDGGAGFAAVRIFAAHE